MDEPKPEAEKKEPRVYKGTVTELGKLDLPALVQTLPNMREPTLAYGVRKLPLFMYIYRNDAYDGAIRMVQYRDPRNGLRAEYAYIKNSTKLNLLSGRMATELHDEISAWKMKNLASTALWPGGSVGCDPEVFVVDTKDGTMIPAFDFLHSKKRPHLVKSEFFDTYITDLASTQTNRVYWDGFQAEFTTRPFGCLAHECDSIWEGLYALHELAQKHSKTAALSIDSVLPVPDGLLESAKDEHVEFGCMPSLNAYGLEGNKLPGRQVPLRFAGGHLHLGIGAQTREKANKIVKALDAVLGVGCVSLFSGYDKAVRRNYYGLPGEFRQPSHGIEYRTLSNAWLIHPMITNVVFEVARFVTGFANDLHLWQASEEETIATIMGADVEQARKILRRNKDLFEGILKKSIFADSTHTLYKLFMSGMGEVLEEPHNIAKNWNLGGVWVRHCEGRDANWTHGHGRLVHDKKVRPTNGERHKG